MMHCVLVAQSCQLFITRGLQPTRLSARRFFQARILEWFAISFSRGSSRPRDQTGSPALQADSLLNELPGKTFPQHRIFQPQIVVPRCRNTTLWLSSVAQSCLTLCNFIDGSMSCIPVHHQLPELTQIHVHRVSDAIQPSHPLSSPSLPGFILSQNQGLFK